MRDYFAKDFGPKSLGIKVKMRIHIVGRKTKWKVTLGREEMPGKEGEEKREWVPGKSRLEDTCLCIL